MSSAPVQEKRAAQTLSHPMTIVLGIALGVVLLVLGFNLLTAKSLRDAAQTAENTIAFARQSVKRHEENISSSRTKSVTSVWEKLEEMDGRFDISDASQDSQIETYLAKTNLHAAFLLDGSLALQRSVGDTAAVDAVLETVLASDGLDELISYPAKSYLSRVTIGSDTYDYAVCASEAVAGSLVVGVNRVEKTDVNGGQVMFNAMFDDYVFAMDGVVVVANDDTVLASNDSDVLGIDRAAFDAELSLADNHDPESLAAGTFNGAGLRPQDHL